MASFLPIISELLPMVLPSSTHIVRARELQPDHATVEGPAVERPAITNMCDKMCVFVLTIRPHSATTIRHNSENDAIMYLVSGAGLLLVNEGIDEDIKRHELTIGDFAFVPAWTEHQARNETDNDTTWLVMQSASRPVGADLTDWGGDEATTRG